MGKLGRLPLSALAIVVILGTLGLALPAARWQGGSEDAARAAVAEESEPSVTATTRPSWRSRRTPRAARTPAASAFAPTPIAAGNVAPPAAVVDGEFQTELAEYLDGRFGMYGLALRDLTTGRTVLVNAEETFLSASTYKLLIMYDIYNRLEEGTLGLGDTLTVTGEDVVEDEPDDGLYPGEEVTVGEALEAMITISSNYATYTLLPLTGGWDGIAADASELGMAQSARMDDGYFWTSPADMLTFLEALSEGRLVSPEASAQMLDLLLGQQINDRIPALLPEAAVVAHKTGELTGVRNDVGIVEGPGGRFVICVYSQEADEEEATAVIAEVARRAYERYAQ
ncbi:MAG: serine hydrolase [Chloroflexota bacterium]